MPDKQSKLAKCAPPRLDSGEKDQVSSMQVTVTRPAVNQDGLKENYAYRRSPPKGCCHSASNFLSYECSPERLKRGLKARLPVVECIRTYSRDYIIGDIVAGITVGIMQIPLGMAYAILGSCPAVTGLYSSFFPVLLYFFLGTSRHISQGTFAITSLMFGKVVDRLASHPSLQNATQATNLLNSSLGNHTNIDVMVESHTGYTAIEVAASLCLIAGILQVLMGFLRVGAFSIYLSDTLISGFTTGAAVLVFTSQFSSFFGIQVPKFSWPFEIIYVYKHVFAHISESNTATIIVSAITIFVLAFTCEVINPRIMPKIKVPIPIELIMVVVGTGVSYAMDFDTGYSMKIVGEIPKGLPLPTVPPVVSLLPKMIGDAFAIAIVTYVISLSLAKIFAKKHNYDINANQEFIAMGVSNSASSFFSCFPMCVALSRSMVLENVGGKTQVAGLLSCVVVLVVLVAIAPLFQTLPNCVLAAIIVVGIRRMFLQFRDFKNAWEISKLEAMTWLITFLSVCFISIDIGLGIGVIFSLLTIVLRSQRPYITSLGWVRETDLYLDVKKYDMAQEETGIKIYHFGGPLLFSNAKTFRKMLYQVTGVNPRAVLKKMLKLQKKEMKGKDTTDSGNIPSIVMVDMSDANPTLLNGSDFGYGGSSNQIMNADHDKGLVGIQNPAFETDGMGGASGIYTRKRSSSERGNEFSVNDDDDKVEELNKKNVKFGSTNSSDLGVSMDSEGQESSFPSCSERSSVLTNGLNYIVIDGSAISFADLTGANSIIQIIEEYSKIDVIVYLAALRGPVMDILDTSELHKVASNHIYPTVRDAVLHALALEKQKTMKLISRDPAANTTQL